MKFGIARKALQIVEDHDIALAAIGSQMLDHADHARARHKIAARSFGVAENCFDGHAKRRGILTAAVFLTELAAAFDLLLLA
ncbi:MAG: hypothetical protein NT015_02960 [Alphaproteobacteria bacterium]|nr:hypothetical protein [Alphaproteobacteria bacterium]